MKAFIRILVAGMFFISQYAFAQEQCPTVKAIQKEKFDFIQKGDHEGVWTLVQNKKYNTNHTWKFSLIVEADTKHAAIRKGNAALATLSPSGKLQKVEKVLECDYKVKAPGMAAMAITPAK